MPLQDQAVDPHANGCRPVIYVRIVHVYAAIISSRRLYRQFRACAQHTAAGVCPHQPVFTLPGKPAEFAALFQNCLQSDRLIRILCIRPADPNVRINRTVQSAYKIVAPCSGFDNILMSACSR